MSTVATSVVSAAVIGGDLILGLSDGSIINCGRVQGPQGLKGDQGPMGATGRAGTDGNTIHTVAGAPDTTLGRDGDYAINTTVWEIYGPRAGGAWGTGTPLRGNRRNGSGEQREAIFGQPTESSGGGGGGGGIREIRGGNGIDTTRLSATAYEVSAEVDETKGLAFGDDNQIEIKIGDGLAFDADTGALISTGGGGKESQPFIDWFQFKVIERSDRFDYDPLFETNANAQTDWEYQLDLQGDGTFITFEDIPEETRIAIGYYSTPTVSHLRLKKTDAQVGTYPNARARFQVTSELNGTVNVDQTCGLPAWENGECDYGNNPFASLESRVDTGEQFNRH